MTLAPTRTIEDAVRGFVAEGSGLPSGNVVPGNDPAPAPIDLYATVLLIESKQEGLLPTIYSDGGAETQGLTLESIDALYSCQWFRDGARDAAEQFRIWAESPNGLLEAGRRGLTFNSVGPLRQIDEIVSSTWEERAGVDLRLGYTLALNRNVGRIPASSIRIAIDPIDETFNIQP